MKIKGIRFRKKQAVVNGCNWGMYITGKKDAAETVLLMHGFPDIPDTWQHQIPVLVEAGYQVIVPFLPGYGESSLMNSSSYYPGNFAQDLPALLDALDLEKVIYIGHDWGAYAGLVFASAAPDRISKLVTCAIPHFQGLMKADLKQVYRSRYILQMTLPGSTAMFRKNNLEKIQNLYREWSPDWPLDQDHVDAVKQCLATNNSLLVALSYYRTSIVKGITDTHLRQLLQSPIRVPTLSIAGANDGCIGIQCYEHQTGGFSGEFHFRKIDGAGHFCHLEKPDEFNQLVTEFLSGKID